MPKPIETVKNGNGHDARGRFVKGNRAARGNGMAHKAARFRAELYRAVSIADFRAIVGQIVKRAKAGESWAAKLAIEHLCGPPRDAELESRLEELESLLNDASRGGQPFPE